MAATSTDERTPDDVWTEFEQGLEVEGRAYEAALLKRIREEELDAAD